MMVMKIKRKEAYTSPTDELIKKNKEYTIKETNKGLYEVVSHTGKVYVVDVKAGQCYLKDSDKKDRRCPGLKYHKRCIHLTLCKSLVPYGLANH